VVSGTALPFASTVYGDPSSTINLAGGQVLGPGPIGGNVGVAIETLGAFAAGGGSAVGADSASLTVDAGYGLFAGGSVSIAGGTFAGGGGPLAGLGAQLSGTGGGVSISGGVFAGGSSGSAAGGEALVLARSGPSTISGGSFSGGAGSAAVGDSMFLQGLGVSSLIVSGGSFTGPIEFDLSDSSSSLAFLGSGFSVGAGDVLTGTLADGSSIDVTLVSDNGDYVQYVTSGPAGLEYLTFGVPPAGGSAVPQPSSLVLLFGGLLGVGSALLCRSRINPGEGPGGVYGRPLLSLLWVARGDLPAGTTPADRGVRR
jgi:hypothetical protein